VSAWNDDQLFSSAVNEGDTTKDEWGTPPELFEPLHQEFQFEVDVAASGYNWMVPSYFGLDNGRDALMLDWPLFGTSFWGNPPYSLASEFLKQGSRFASENLGLTIVFLVFARTDTEWWWRYVLGRNPKTRERIPGVFCATEIRWHPGRIRFLDPKTSSPRRSEKTGQIQAAPAPSVLVIFRPDPLGESREWPENGVF